MRIIAWCLFFVCTTVNAQIKNYFLGGAAISGEEVSISLNPTDREDIWLAFNNNRVVHSLNGGEQWLNVKVNPVQGFYGDPVIYNSTEGSIYLAHLAKNPDKKWPEQFDCIVFERSTNGVEFHSKCIGKNGNKMQDKPWFSVDENFESPFNGNIYLTWTEFDKYGSSASEDSSRIKFVSSNDHGASFSEPITISDVSGDALDDDKTAEGAVTVSLYDGTLLCVWSRNDTLWLDRSLDAGKTWGKDEPLARMHGGWSYSEIPGMSRENGLPFICLDKKGRVYITYATENYTGDWDVYYLYSKDGKSFSDPIKVNDDKSRGDQFMPYMEMDRSIGYPRVIWYDTRNSQTNKFAHVYTSILKKKCPQKNVNLTLDPIPLPGKKAFMGDYISFSTVQNEGGFAGITSINPTSKSNGILILEWFGKKPNRKIFPPSLIVNPNGDSDSIWVALCIPFETSCTFELKMGNRTIMQKYYGHADRSEFGEFELIEVAIPRKIIPPGASTFILSRRNKSVKLNYWSD